MAWSDIMSEARLVDWAEGIDRAQLVVVAFSCGLWPLGTGFIGSRSYASDALCRGDCGGSDRYFPKLCGSSKCLRSAVSGSTGKNKN